MTELAEQAAEHGTLGGLGIETIHRAAEEEAAMLAEMLPFGSPENLYLVNSRPLLLEVRRTLVQRLGCVAEHAAQCVQLLTLISITMVPDFDPNAIDRLTPDRQDDPVVHTAFEGRADFIVTTDDHLLVDGEGTEYTRLDGRSARAYSLTTFASMIETSTFTLEAVPDVLGVKAGDRPRLPVEPGEMS